MDIWANVSFGSRWTGDDGTQHSKVKVQQEVQITSLSTGAKDLKKMFIKAVSEAYDRCVELEELLDKHGV